MKALAAIVLAACGSEPARTPSPTFLFSVDVEVLNDTTHVTVDGAPLALVPNNNAGRDVVYTAEFASYADAQAAPPVTFEFFAGSEIRAIAHATAGACATACSDPICFPVSKLLGETIHEVQGDFLPGDWITVGCELPDGSDLDII